MIVSIMNCSRVMSSLFVGPDLREAADFEQLKSLNVTAILSLQSNDDLRNREPGWEERTAVGAGLVFEEVPITDFDSAELCLKLPSRVAALDRMLKAGHTVYVHCTAGVNRSPTVVVAYLHWCLDWPLEQALAHVKRVRNCCPDPEAIRHAHWPGD